MDPSLLPVLFALALAAGALNSVAGGGSFLTFPGLVFAGVPPVSANATSAVVLYPAGIASATAYRHDMGYERRMLVLLTIVSLIGGYVGARVLLGTPDEAFARLVPWLLLAATAFFAIGDPVVRRLHKYTAPNGAITIPLLAGVTLVQFAIAVYGGYFGGGMGFPMLAVFTILGIESVHAMNGLKMLLATAIKTVAIGAFLVAGIVAWTPALVMVAGSVIGGYGGARLARRVPQHLVRRAVVVVGLVLTGVFFLRAYA